MVRDCNDAHGHDLACICPFLPGGPKCFDVLKTQLSVCQGQCKFSFSLRLKSALIATRVHDLISEKHVHMPRARMGYQGLECGSGSRLNCHRGTPSICSHGKDISQNCSVLVSVSSFCPLNPRDNFNIPLAVQSLELRCGERTFQTKRNYHSNTSSIAATFQASTDLQTMGARLAKTWLWRSGSWMALARPSSFS